MAGKSDTQSMPAVVKGFGGWKKPSQSGVGGLSLRATMILGVAAAFLILVMGTMGMLAAIEIGGPIVLVVALMVIGDADGVMLSAKISERAAWAMKVASGTNIYKAGPASKATGGKFQLPGIGAQLEVSDHADIMGNRFGMVYCPSQKTATVIFGCEPGGVSMLDEDEIDNQVAYYAGWLSQLGLEPDVVAASVTVETAPDPGKRLEQVVASRVDPDAPEIARRVLQDSVDAGRGGATQVSTWVAVTFTTSNMGRKVRDVDGVATSLSQRLGTLRGGLVPSGAGGIWNLNSSNIAELVRIAYDPASAVWFDQVHASGQTPQLAWSDVGPSAAVASWGGYQHDSAYSITWAMSGAPKGIVNSGVLRPLLAPSADIARKRVTMLYRPIEPGAAARMVDDDLTAASAARGNVRKPEVRMTQALRQAQQTAAEQANGAGLLEFGILVTATTDDLDMRDQVVHTLRNLGASARIRLRPMYGMQDAAFVACLPLGVMLERASILPQATKGR